MSKSPSLYPVLENLFNSKLRVKVLKFLFRNSLGQVGVRDLAKRIQESYPLVTREIKSLEKIGLVKKLKN